MARGPGALWGPGPHKQDLCVGDDQHAVFIGRPAKMADVRRNWGKSRPGPLIYRNGGPYTFATPFAMWPFYCFVIFFLRKFIRWILRLSIIFSNVANLAFRMSLRR